MKHISHSVGRLINKFIVHQVIEERRLHSEKVSAWCTLCSEDVIGTYFFESDDRTTVTNSELYDRMIIEFFLPAIEEYDLENM